MAPRFQNSFQIPVSVQEYYKAIEVFINAEREDHLKFIFKLFDVFNEDKITEAGLFKFMEDASIRRYDQPSVPTDILKLGETENDIFLEIFTNTYSKLVDALNKKLKKMRHSALDMKAKLSRHMSTVIQ